MLNINYLQPHQRLLQLRRDKFVVSLQYDRPYSHPSHSVTRIRVSHNLRTRSPTVLERKMVGSNDPVLSEQVYHALHLHSRQF